MEASTVIAAAAVVQAIASGLAIFVAGAALWIAHGAREAERAQAAAARDALSAARQQIEQAREADRASQRQAQILAIQPLLIAEPNITRQRNASLTIDVPLTNPALGLTVTLRRDGLDASRSVGLGSRAPGAQVAARFPLAPFIKPDTEPFEVTGDPHEVVATYHGSMGQMVVEHYEWYLGDPAAVTPVRMRRRWRLSRLEIVPAVDGAKGLDLRFGT